MPKFSIIVPIFNSEKYLEKCINSLINQTFKYIEIILVNDGSTDNSEKIIKKYTKDIRVVYLKKENGGQGSARNMGLKNAKGKYICFLDSYDYVDIKMCEKMYEASLCKYDIVVCDYFITNREGNDSYITILNRDSGKLDNYEYFFTGACPWNKLYKKTFLDKINFKFPEGIIYEDFAVIPTLSLYNPQIYYLKEAFVHYVQSDNSTMRAEKYKMKHEDIFKAADYLYNILKKTKYQDELTYLMAYHLLLEGSLYFYRFKKYENIDKIAEFMHKEFPLWAKNKYVKKFSIKHKILMHLFYHRKYKTIKFIQRLKGRV